MVSSALDIILLSWYWLVVAIVYESAVWGDPPKTLGAVPMTEQAVWGVGSAGKPRAPSQRPVPRDCRDHNCFQSSKTLRKVIASGVAVLVLASCAQAQFLHDAHSPCHKFCLTQCFLHDCCYLDHDQQDLGANLAIF